MTASFSQRSFLGAILAILGGFMAFCAGGAMLAFRWMAYQHPAFNETGPWPRARTAIPGPVGEVTNFLSHHFWAAVSIQLTLGLVLLLVGVLLMRGRTRIRV